MLAVAPVSTCVGGGLLCHLWAHYRNAEMFFLARSGHYTEIFTFVTN